MTTTTATAVRLSTTPADRLRKAIAEAKAWTAKTVKAAREQERKAAEALKAARERTRKAAAEHKAMIADAKRKAKLAEEKAAEAKRKADEKAAAKAAKPGRASAASVIVDGKRYGISATAYMDCTNPTSRRKSPLDGASAKVIRAIVAKAVGGECPAGFRLERKGNKTGYTFTTTADGRLAFERK